METLVTIQNNKTLTTSKLIATAFEKAHAHVIRDIENLECSVNFRQSNFGLSFYEQEMPKGGVKKSPMYHITRDGFTFLAMGYTGKRAAEFKEAYINQFNEMEAKIKAPQNDYIIALTNKVNDLSEKIDRISLPEPKMFTAKIYVEMVGKKFPGGYMTNLAKIAKQFQIEKGIPLIYNKYVPEALDYAIKMTEDRIQELKDKDIEFLKTNKTAQSLKLMKVGEYMLFHGTPIENDVYSVINKIHNVTTLVFDTDFRSYTMNPSIKVTRKK